MDEEMRESILIEFIKNDHITLQEISQNTGIALYFQYREFYGVSS